MITSSRFGIFGKGLGNGPSVLDWVLLSLGVGSTVALGILVTKKSKVMFADQEGKSNVRSGRVVSQHAVEPRAAQIEAPRSGQLMVAAVTSTAIEASFGTQKVDDGRLDHQPGSLDLASPVLTSRPIIDPGPSGEDPGTRLGNLAMSDHRVSR
jgi:hypothetical protein